VGRDSKPELAKYEAQVLTAELVTEISHVISGRLSYGVLTACHMLILIFV